MTPEQVMYNIIILHPMSVNILISIKQHHELFHFGVTPSYGRTVSMSGIVNLFDCCITVSIVLLQRQENISWLHHGLRHINNNNISSLVSRPAYGCPTNEFVISVNSQSTVRACSYQIILLRPILTTPFASY